MKLHLNAKSFKLFAAISGLLAVGLGAFAAHGLKGSLSSYSLGIWQTAVFYQFVHTLVILQLSHLVSSRLLIRSQTWFALGIILFCGSLYVLALTGITKLGMLTPVGGVCWLYLIVNIIKQD